MKKEECLKTAMEIVNGDRQTNYGKPEDNFKRIAQLWECYLRNREGEMLDIINKEDVAIMMMLMKIARLMNNPHHTDSYVDICGYAACGCDMTTEVSLPTLYSFMFHTSNKPNVEEKPLGETKPEDAVDVAPLKFPDVDKMFKTFGDIKPKRKYNKKGKKDGVRKSVQKKS